jgi:hypothetical protein
MIKLKSLLKENTTFDFAQAADVKFISSAKEGKIVLIPASTKDVAKVDTIKEKLGDGADDDFLSLVQIRLEKKLGLKVIADKRHSGAGFAFEIDMDELVKKL